ncbi:putative flavoprotein [Desulfosporosinus acidiphilus SJ4]|uniref:Putative flavoprotein n=1 Tax=Desulfosporosinus acidiphilus (strain DSM 22704 / JCM 16185 / SJ4) TaxID=646529 RepID=I4D1M8_DESAJ|nr:FprA family A-type flavoprotein [Desulfosporosinus acidiphilus]AFM39702.1 putative flavoprotein [Desulfosporosinus acidiphilus SJ4]
MKAIEVKHGIYWVGALNPDLRIFDVIMETKSGTTYNSYLVRGENKTALFEVVKDGFENELIERISSVIDPEAIDYIIFDHTEPDHSGSIQNVLLKMPKAQVLGSQAAITFLSQILNTDFNKRIVKHGEELDLGGKTLRFLSTPFLHWPDTMMTYLPEDKILFSCDAFGSHFCNQELFNDLVGDFSEEFKFYYDAIIYPFSNYALEAASKIKDLEIDMICPSHGPILRQDPWSYINSYVDWSTREMEEGSKSVIVIYTSNYGYTARLAKEIAVGLADGGVKVEVMDILEHSKADLRKKIDLADGLLIGSPTFNRDAIPPIWELLAEVSAIINKGKPAAAFGSYGWSGEAVKYMEQRLQQLQFKITQPGLRVNFVPNADNLEEARNFGREFASVVANKT